MHLIYPNQSLKQAKAGAATLPVPSAVTDGVDATGWVAGGAGYPKAYVVLTADGTATITSPVLYGLEPVTGLWCQIGQLNEGASISLTATLGYAETFDLPTVFTRLAVGGTVSAGNVGYTMVPIKEDL